VGRQKCVGRDKLDGQNTDVTCPSEMSVRNSLTRFDALSRVCA
jgi:hypothetical protein